MKTKKLVLSAIFVAAALALSYTERLIPLNLVVPLPGVKLGLANIVTMLALYTMGLGQGLAILLLRCVLGSVFGGGISGLAMSLTGGVLAYGVMALARRCPLFSIYGVSLLGAAAHNVGQVLAAAVMMGSVYTLWYLPFLLLAGLVMGTVTGTISAYTFRALRAAGKFPEGSRP